MATLKEQKSILTNNKSNTSLSASDITKNESRPSSRLDPDIEYGVPVIDTTDDADEKVGISRVVSASAGVVDWNDQDDVRRPINWTTKKKWINCAIISVLTFLTPLASSMGKFWLTAVVKQISTTIHCEYLN